MTALAVVGVAVAIGLVALVIASLRQAGRALEGDLSRFVAWKAEETERLDRRDDALTERERDLSLRAQALEETYAERERLWVEERRELLDRIQAPQAAAARIFADAMPDEDPATADLDQAADREYAEQPEARVEWDPDLGDFHPTEAAAPTTTAGVA